LSYGVKRKPFIDWGGGGGGHRMTHCLLSYGPLGKTQKFKLWYYENCVKAVLVLHFQRVRQQKGTNIDII
jgi:hypothetical protein